jgi:hypothetical protein
MTPSTSRKIPTSDLATSEPTSGSRIPGSDSPLRFLRAARRRGRRVAT